MQVELICPECYNPVTVLPEWSGKVVICPHCNMGITVPKIAPAPPPPPPPAKKTSGEKVLSATEEKLLLTKLDAIRAEYDDLEDYPAWNRGLRNLLSAAVPCGILLLLLMLLGIESRAVYIVAGCSLAIMFIFWTFGTFRSPE